MHITKLIWYWYIRIFHEICARVARLFSISSRWQVFFAHCWGRKAHLHIRGVRIWSQNWSQMFKLLLQVICVVRAVCKKALEAPYSGRQKSFEPCNHLNITSYVQSATAVTVAILAQGTTHGPMRSRRPFLTPDQFRQRNPALCRLSVNIGLYLPVSTSICQYLPASICQWQNTSVCLSNRPLPPWFVWRTNP